jgi:hypothetical protein
VSNDHEPFPSSDQVPGLPGTSMSLRLEASKRGSQRGGSRPTGAPLREIIALFANIIADELIAERPTGPSLRTSSATSASEGESASI